MFSSGRGALRWNSSWGLKCAVEGHDRAKVWPQPSIRAGNVGRDHFRFAKRRCKMQQMQRSYLQSLLCHAENRTCSIPSGEGDIGPLLAYRGLIGRYQQNNCRVISTIGDAVQPCTVTPRHSFTAISTAAGNCLQSPDQPPIHIIQSRFNGFPGAFDAYCGAVRQGSSCTVCAGRIPILLTVSGCTYFNHRG